MRIAVDRESTVALHDQVRRAVVDAVTTGELTPGDRLPSARDLAWAIRVNLHTVLRAYGELEDAGVLEVKRGRGTSVRKDVNIAAVERANMLKQEARRAREAGVPFTHALRILEETWL